MKVNGMEYDDIHISMFLEKLFWSCGEGPQSAQKLLEKLAYGNNVVIADELHEETLEKVVGLKSRIKKSISLIHDLKKSLKSAQNDNYDERKKSRSLESECDIYATQIAEYERICGLVNLWEKRPKKDTVMDVAEYDPDSVWDPDEDDEIEF